MSNATRPTNAPASSGFETFVLGIAGVVVAAGAVLWLGAQTASLVRNHRPLDLNAQGAAIALRRLPDTIGDPRLAFAEPLRDQLPGPLLFWPCLLLSVAVAGCVAYGLWRVFRSGRTPLDQRKRLGVNRPGFCGGSIAWKGRWSYARHPPRPEEVPARAA